MGDCSRAGNVWVYNQPSRSTQPSTQRLWSYDLTALYKSIIIIIIIICGMVKWVSASGLSNNDGDGETSFWPAYRRTNGSSPWAWSKGWRPSGTVLQSSPEPGVLLPYSYYQSINQSIHVYFRHMVHSYNNNNIIVIIITSSHGPGGQKALASAFSRAVLPNTVDVCCY